MKITIETSDADRVALQPEIQPLLRQAAGTTGSISLDATDGGAPSEELLQSFGRKGDPQSASSGPNSEDAYSGMVMAGGEPSLSRH